MRRVHVRVSTDRDMLMREQFGIVGDAEVHRLLAERPNVHSIGDTVAILSNVTDVDRGHSLTHFA